MKKQQKRLKHSGARKRIVIWTILLAVLAVACSQQRDPETVKAAVTASGYAGPVAVLDDVVQAGQDPNVVLLDIRSYDDYVGKSLSEGAARPGHIPGAVWIGYSLFMQGDEANGYMPKSTEEVWKVISDNGISAEQAVVVYGGDGIRSGEITNLLAGQLGFTNVKNYAGSWIEYAGRNDLPVEKISWKQIVGNAYSGYAGYLWASITFQLNPWYKNYFWYLVLVSLFFFALELIKPWRKEQGKFRKGFWMDFFYMFFNFFLFSLIIYNAFSDVFVNLFNSLLWKIGVNNLVAIEIGSWPVWAQLLTLFFVADFFQWNIHRLLHRVPFLWRFHKVHHSVEEMGFAAHLRYHWMETLVYKSIQYIPLAMIGFGIDDFFLVYIFNIAIGHYNHSNIQVHKRVKGGLFGALLGVIAIAILAESSITFADSTGTWVAIGLLVGGAGIGVLALGGLVNYIFNSPEMHIWHHAMELPEDKPYGVNFGLTLSIWDYIFKTNHIPHDGRDIQLGFEDLDEFPKTFWGQIVYGFWNKKN